MLVFGYMKAIVRPQCISQRPSQPDSQVWVGEPQQMLLMNQCTAQFRAFQQRLKFSLILRRHINCKEIEKDPEEMEFNQEKVLCLVLGSN